jgi:hypothetical protein
MKHVFKWYYNCGFKLLETSEINKDIKEQQKQFNENENQENWTFPNFFKNEKKKDKTPQSIS